MKLNSNSQYLQTFLILAALVLAPAAHGESSVVTPPLTKCNIEVDNPHISKYLLRTKGIRAVKVNARSKCNKAMSNLNLTVEIYTVGLFSDHKAGKNVVTIQGQIRPNKIVKNEKTFVRCSNNKKSKFYGIAYASAVIEGKTIKTFHVITEKNISLNCGY
jgi:hypothetical protein